LKEIPINSKWEWMKDTIPIFVFIALICIFFSDVLFANKIFVHRDLIRSYYPLREFSAIQFRAGSIPLWDPYLHCGTSHIAEIQNSVFYPLSIIYMLFSYPQAFNYFIILHIFLAGVFTYLLMREWNYSRYGSFFSGLIFMFGGYIISAINLVPQLTSVAWLPIVILFYERSLGKKWLKNSMLTGIFLTLMFLGGSPAVFYLTCFILVFLGFRQKSAKGAYFEKVNRRGRLNLNTSYIRCLIPLALALLVFIGLSCFQILPFLEIIKESPRATMHFNEVSIWSFPPYAFLDLFVPYLSDSDYLYKEYWIRQSLILTFYMGIFTVICVVLSLKFDVTEKRKTFFYLLAVSLLLSLGRYTPIYYFLYNFIPGFGLLRYPVKFFFMAAFSLAILAGMGLEYYRENISSSENLRRFLKGILIFGVISSFFYLMINLNFTATSDFLHRKILAIVPSFIDKASDVRDFIYVGMHNIKRSLYVFMYLSVLMFLPLKKKIRSNLIIPILLFISFMDLLTANRIVYQNMDIDEYLKPGRTIEFLKEDKTLFRTFTSPVTLKENRFLPERDYFESIRILKERLVSDRGVGFQIYDIYGYEQFFPKRNEDIIKIIMQQASPDETNLLNLLNVKYIASIKDFSAKGYRLVKRNKNINIYENKNVLPRVFLVDKAVLIKDEEEILKRLKSKDFNPSKEIILEEDFASLDDIKRKGRVDILEYKPNEVIIEATVDDKKFLVLGDTFYPGWKVYVDGRREKIYRTDYILRSVYLERGKHIIKFIYDPYSFKMGAIITLIVISILLGFFFVRRLIFIHR